MRIFAVGDLTLSTTRGTPRRASSLLSGLRELGVEVILAPTMRSRHPSAEWAAANGIEVASPASLPRNSSGTDWFLAFTQSSSKLVAQLNLEPRRVLWDLHGLHVAEAMETWIAPRSAASIVKAEVRTRLMLRSSPLVITATERLARWYRLDSERTQVIQGGYTLDDLGDCEIRPETATTRQRRLTYVGNLARYQGVRGLIAALDRVTDELRPQLAIYSYDQLPSSWTREWVDYRGGAGRRDWANEALSGAALIVPRHRPSAASFGYPSKVYDYALLGAPIMLGPSVPQGPTELERLCTRLPQLDPEAVLLATDECLREQQPLVLSRRKALNSQLWSLQLDRVLSRL